MAMEKRGSLRKLIGASVGPAAAAAASLWSVTALIAEIAAKSTARQGVASSTWTPTTSITAAIFGSNHMHGDWDAGPIVVGALVLLLASFLAALPCVALIAYALGWKPNREAAVIFGVVLGVGVEVAVFNLLLNWLQPQNEVYRALPSWGWWAGMAAWGATLGAAMARCGGETATATEVPAEAAPA